MGLISTSREIPAAKSWIPQKRGNLDIQSQTIQSYRLWDILDSYIMSVVTRCGYNLTIISFVYFGRILHTAVTNLHCVSVKNFM